MATPSASLKFACILIISMAVTAPHHAGAAISCGTVMGSISSCIGYVQRGGAVPLACCDGFKSINAATKATPDLQAACQCLKSLIPSVGANPSLVNGLPAKCGVNFPYKYSPSLDCSKLTRCPDETSK